MHNEFFKFWENAAKNYETWQNITPKWDQNSLPSTKLFVDFLQNWFETMNKMYMNPSEEYTKHKNQQTFGLFQDLEQKFLHTLSKMTADNLIQSYQQSLQNTAQMFQDGQSVDPKILWEYFQKIMTEYLKDIEEIPGNAKKIDLQNLWEIWNKILSGQIDKSSGKYVDRFQESLRVKLQYGMEYYADPEKTKVGFTPRNLVWKKGKYQLFHYPAKEPKDAPPLLIIYSLINKPYILDLLPGCSLIEFFTQNGLEVYLIDWGETEYNDRNITLDSLISPTISEIVEFVIAYAKSSQVSLLGHCIGGVLASLYASLFPSKVAQLVTLTTPITGTDGGVVGLWAHLMPTKEILQIFGNMPAKLIRYTFIGLKPYYEVIRWKKFYENLDKMNDSAMTAFNAVDKWINDNLDVPGEVFRKFISEIYQQDHLKQGKTIINGQVASLANITCPLLNIVADEDWIVTPPSAKILNDLVTSEINIQKIIPGQHLSIIFHPKNRPVWQEMLNFFFCRNQIE